MFDRQLPDLTPPTDAPRRWKVVGLELAHKCTFCGDPSEATVGCPDETAPLIFQVGVCSHCLTDAVMARFAEVKAARTAQLAMDMAAASDAIVVERRKFHSEQNRRRQVAHYQLLTDERAAPPGKRRGTRTRATAAFRRNGRTKESASAS